MLSHPDATVDHLQAGMEDLRVDNGNSSYYYNHGQQQPEQTFGNDEDDSDDDEPLSMAPSSAARPAPPQLNNQGKGRLVPVTVRNPSSHLNSSRPPQFIKPVNQTTNTLQAIPADIQSTQTMYNNYTDKTYLEGYMMKMNDLTVDGTSYGDSQWTRWYVEISGPVLTLWDAESPTTTDIDENGTGPVIPQYINLADASASIVDEENGVISLNSAGSNRFLLQPLDPSTFSPSSSQAVLWVLAMRLSCFEWSRIHELYTMDFFTRYNDDVVAATTTVPKMEGFVQVRLAGATDWRKYWVVVSDRRDEKTFFGKKKVPDRGQLFFYDTKKQKHPNFTLVNVGHAYTLYPESPQLIDMATILKVEGTMIATSGGDKESNNNQQPTSALIMASSRKELIQWLVAVFDSFKLYGRPGKLLDDPLNINSLNFGALAATTNPRVFLELADIQQIDVIQDTYADNVPNFCGVLLNKMTQNPNPNSLHQQQWAPQNDNDFRRSLPLEPPGNRSQTTLPPPDQNGSLQAMTPSSSSRGGKLIYASDSEEEEDEEEDDDDDSDSDGDNHVLKSLKSGGQQPPESPKKTKQQQRKQPEDEEDTDDDRSTISGISESSAPAQSKPPLASTSRPRRRRIARPQASVSGSGTESDDDDNSNNNMNHQRKHDNQGSDYSTDDEHGLIRDGNSNINRQPSPMMSMGNPSGQFYDQDLQHQQLHNEGMMYDPMTGMYYGDGPGGLEMGEDGPIIPELGSRFATQNSLLDTYRPDHPSANDQMEYSRQTGHTLLSVPTKPPEPRTGLVGMISQIEVDKKEQKLNKGRVLQMEKDRLLERERERYMWEQRQSMVPQMGMNQANMGQFGMGQMGMSQYGMGQQMPMMDPRMSMMPPPMMGQMPPMMGQMPPMMDPRMSMMSPSMMSLATNNNSSSNLNLDPRMSTMNKPRPSSSTETANMMPPPMMDPRVSMMPPMMGQMPMMMDPRMSMMNMQMMMAMYQNNNAMWSQQQQHMNHFDPALMSDDEDDDVPLGGPATGAKH